MARPKLTEEEKAKRAAERKTAKEVKTNFPVQIPEDGQNPPSPIEATGYTTTDKPLSPPQTTEEILKEMQVGEMIQKLPPGTVVSTATDDRNAASSKFFRDHLGLLVSVKHVFNEDGSVNWKAMIPDEYIEINSEYFNRKKEELPKSKEGLKDHQLIIKLGGTKEVAKIRGIHSVEKEVVYSDPDRSVVKCRVTFIPNYESNKKLVYEAVASATIGNTNQWGQMFLDAIAENRAFVRAVRNALRIDIVSSEEMFSVNESDNSESSNTEIWKPLEIALASMKTSEYPNGIKTFEEFKEHCIKRGIDAAKEWTKYGDIPGSDIFKFIKNVKSANNAKRAQ